MLLYNLLNLFKKCYKISITMHIVGNHNHSLCNFKHVQLSSEQAQR